MTWVDQLLGKDISLSDETEPRRKTLNFVESDGVTITASDSIYKDQTDIVIDTEYAPDLEAVLSQGEGSNDANGISLENLGAPSDSGVARVSDVDSEIDPLRDAIAELAVRTWFLISAIEQNEWRGIAWSDSLGVFTVTSADGSNRSATSSDGIIWDAHTGSSESIVSVVRAESLGLFVGVGTDVFATSADGEAWADDSAPTAGWASIAWSGSRLVAVASSGTNRIMYSDDGENWTPTNAPEVNPWQSVTWADGIGFVAVSNDGDNRVAVSEDGESWAVHAASEQSAWSSVAFAGGYLVAVATSGTNRVMRSTDGESWESIAVTSGAWSSIAYSEELRVAVAVGDSVAMSSRDGGETWVAQTVPAVAWKTIAWAASIGRFCAVSDDRIMVSL